MSTSSSLFSSWSDIPIDILLRIRDMLELHHRFDLIPFRTVCSHWRSIIPVPNNLPRYKISFEIQKNVIRFTKFKNFHDIENNMCISRAISLSFFASSQMSLFCSSNGWLVVTSSHKNIFLFNPVLNQELIFPPISYHMLKPTNHNISQLLIRKVVVSSSANLGIVVACIVEIFYQNPYIIDKRFVVCRHGNGQRWRLFMEASKGIIDIILAGNGCIYALNKLKLYMLDERPPMIKLVGFRLWFPKQVLNEDGENDPVDKQLCVNGCRMEAGGGSELNIYVKVYPLGWRSWNAPHWITLNFDAAKICSNNIDVDVACKAEWTDPLNTSWSCGEYYTPLHRDLSFKRC